MLEVLVLKKYDGNLHRSALMSVLTAYVTISIILAIALFLPNDNEQMAPPYFMEQIAMNPSSFLIVGILIASFLLVYLYIKTNQNSDGIDVA